MDHMLSNSIYLIFRVTPESEVEDDLDASILSLGLFPGEYLKQSRESVSNAPASKLTHFKHCHSI